MATTVFNIMSVAFPSISNRIKASVFREADLSAAIVTEIDSISGHPARTWSFPGLPRNNYAFSLDEIDGGGAVVRNIAFFDCTPDEIDGTLNRKDEQIQVGTEPGFDAGVNTFTFDGSETFTGSGIFKKDYRGWEIVPSELTGRGILVKTYQDYTWNKDTAVFTLLVSGDVFSVGTWYNIHFNPQTQTVGNSYPTVTDFTIRLVTDTGDLLSEDFGNEIIVEPGSEYIELKLPSIITVPQGRKLMVQIGGNSCCVKFPPFGSDTINFLNGNIYALPNETFGIYRFNRSAGVDEWRVTDCDGNFKTVGQSVPDDSVAASVWNKHLCDGAVESTLRYARIFNEVVLNLPFGQTVSFSTWNTGNNKYYFSLDNGSNQFHFPDRRGIFERNNSGGKAGDFFLDQIKETDITVPSTTTGAGGINALQFNGNKNTDVNIPIPSTVGNTETFPKNYLINKYVLI